MTDDDDSSLEAFRAELQHLFFEVRRPTYRSLAGHADRLGLVLRTSTVGDLLNGPGVPRWETVEAFVRACGRHARAHRIDAPATFFDLDGWHARYRALRVVAPAPQARKSRRNGREREVVPAQLPADVAGFAGRREHLSRLNALLTGRTAEGGGAGEGGGAEEGGRAGEGGRAVVIATVSGTAGVGKTALAVQWAHSVAHRFPDGQLYVNLRGFDPGGQVMDPAEAIRGFLDALGVPPDRVPPGLAAQAGLYRSLIADMRLLILLDNARDAEQTRPLLPVTGTSMAVVTSRNPLTGLIAAQGAHPMMLDVLSEDEAREVLVHRIGADRVDAEPAAVHDIVTACARLPLALAIAAARARQTRFPLAALAAELGDAEQRLDALDAGDPASQIRAVFSSSYATLTAPAARLFRLLGLHPGPDVDASAAADLVGRPLPETRRLLTELTRANLLTEHAPARYTFHDLLRRYASELAETCDTEGQRRDATSRLLGHYLHTAHAGEQLLHPNRYPITIVPAPPDVVPRRLVDDRQVLDWFSAERRVLLAVIEHAAATGFDAYAWQIFWSMRTFLERRGHWHDSDVAATTATAAAERHGDLNGRLQIHRIVADAHVRLGRFDAAHVELHRALDVGVRADDKSGLGLTHLGLALLWDRQGDPRQALDHAYQCLHLSQAAADPVGKGYALSAISWCHAQLGENEAALAASEQALALHQELGNRTLQAATWDTLGYIRHHLGDHGEAVTCYQQGLALYRELGDRYYEADVLHHLGDTYAATGDERAARDTWHQALGILDELQHHEAAAVRAKLGTGPGDGADPSPGR